MLAVKTELIWKSNKTKTFKFHGKGKKLQCFFGFVFIIGAIHRMELILKLAKIKYDENAELVNLLRLVMVTR